ncbi:MAG TPA: ABC transporter ATP-binding protein [Vicinamibacterales bacterium]|nr:ABC transporter ATP-binding protein [Vicinamibacterales bacterium]
MTAPPSPRSGFGEVSPERAGTTDRAKAEPGDYAAAHDRTERSPAVARDSRTSRAKAGATRSAPAHRATVPKAERSIEEDLAPARRSLGEGGKPPAVIFEEVSKFYGDVLGVNRVTLNIPAGITSLVGPNGSGKTTLMNLMTGLIFPDHGRILMRGISPRDPETLMRITGYATQYDTAPRWATGFTFITTGLLLFGYGRSEAEERAWKALERLGLTDAATRKVAAYSKGMRQRVRLAQAIAHDPDLLVLDEPLNGLDPLVRAETIDLFRSWAAEGKHVILSSHVLQEVDVISDQVILMANGMIVAEGKVRGVRDEIQEHPSQYIVRCRSASEIAARLFNEDHVTEIRLNEDRMGMLVMTRDREQFARALGQIALDGHRIESVVPADENVDALYEYLIGGESW